MTNKPCLTCGEPSPSSHCEEHQPRAWQHYEGSARARGYSASWDKLSRRARRLQPFCTDCGATHDLQLDHTERTWQRIEAGKVVRLSDTGGVVCGPCNIQRGAARGRETPGTGAGSEGKGPRGKAQGPSLSGRRLGQHLPVEPVAVLDNRHPVTRPNEIGVTPGSDLQGPARDDLELVVVVVGDGAVSGDERLVSHSRSLS